MKKIIYTLLLCLTFSGAGNFLFPKQASAQSFELIKAKDFGTVYYVDGQGVRHPFPNAITYESWYGQDFKSVAVVSTTDLANYPLGRNITIRPGTYLVKVRTSPKVYAVEQGGVLRELQNESIAESIYGENWAQRVVDVPDVFFGDYQIGQPIVHDYTIPEGVLYKEKDKDIYFYKNAGILRQFASFNDVLANHFNPDFALEASRSYFVRARKIVGKDKNIFNPTAAPISDQRDCANTNLKAAIIMVADKQVASAEIDKLQKIKMEIPGAYAYATQGLSNVSVNYPTTILLDDGYLLDKNPDGTAAVQNEVLNTFYDNHPDEFDFVIIFTNFTIPPEANTNEIARFVPVSNKLEGINRGNLARGEIFGSQGKLKGIIVMGNINKYDISDLSGLNQVLNIVNHEFLHNWAAYINFTDDNGENSNALLRSDDQQHWSIYAGFISPLGGSGWIDNGDGTFTSGLLNFPENSLRRYSDLDLYLMGLKPRQFMEDIMYLVPAVPGELDNTIKAQAKFVTIDQIIKANGQHQCSIF